ncbi:divergent protein kinase domain 2A-like [Maniola hyperantus]|uniref:divergent protein kinase domain 2A-like n=1 Tax=Aphantopus hyperantus TaxID=2795564 RepID=UPI00156997E9|nr:divergent protein kinase domain 2A [Maniola hyperantus]
MNENYNRMLLRRRFCKRVVLMLTAFTVSFYASVLLFGGFKGPQVMRLTDLNRCPACYGVTVCPELYSNQITLDSNHWNMFNAKNIYYGYTKSNRRVVLKKLAHDWELKEFDDKLCDTWHLKHSCKVIQLLNMTNIDEKLLNIVEFNLSWPDTKPRKGLVMCPYAYSVYDLIQSLLNNKRESYKSEIINIWTMLSINPEPIILQVIPKSKGWPVPPFGGVCGRLEVVGHEGEPLSTLLHVAWHRKLKYAQKILDAAMDFTFKHDRFRFYLMDWSLDNIVANGKDEITFVDLEDLVVLDKHISPKKDLPDWYQRYSRELMGPGFTFSIENMCRHHLSDHNLWAACYILAGDDNPLIYPIPKKVNTSRPHFDRLLSTCLNGEDRFRTVRKLQHVIEEMLSDEKIVGFGAVR